MLKPDISKPKPGEFQINFRDFDRSQRQEIFLSYCMKICTLGLRARVAGNKQLQCQSLLPGDENATATRPGKRNPEILNDADLRELNEKAACLNLH